MATITKSVQLSELALLSVQEKSEVVNSVFRDALYPSEQRINDQVSDLEKQIKCFELQHGISSDAMRSQIIRGLLQETSEICSWLMLLNLREHFNDRKNKAST